MLEWLVPSSLFWPIAAIILGGSPLEFRGGGMVRHSIGLLITYGLFLVIWWVARAALRGPLGATAAMLAATAITSVLLPLTSRVAYRLIGVRITGPLFAGG